MGSPVPYFTDITTQPEFYLSKCVPCILKQRKEAWEAYKRSKTPVDWSQFINANVAYIQLHRRLNQGNWPNLDDNIALEVAREVQKRNEK